MKINPDPNTQAQVDNAHLAGVAVSVQKDLHRIQSENTLRNELKDREHAYVPSTSNGAMRDEVEQLIKEVSKLKKALAEREAVTLEWMHGNEVFKRLALKFVKQTNVSSEAFREMIAQEALTVAQEDPVFIDTNFLRRAKERLGQQTSTPTQSGGSGAAIEDGTT